MKVDLNRENTTLKFEVALEAEDRPKSVGQNDKQITLCAKTFRFVLPITNIEMHPDLLGAALLTIVLPFVGRRVELPRPVSTALANVVFDEFGVELTPINSQLDARAPGIRPGLSFSGGVDSLAAALLMPDDSALVFCERIKHSKVTAPKESDTFDSGAALETCAALKKDKRFVYSVQSDQEYLIGPAPDWATWISKASPLMLMADTLNLDSISFGTVLGTTYLAVWNQHHYKAVDDVNHPWAKVMATIGLPLARPVGGISEVGTTAIVAASPYKDKSTSCANGAQGQACMLCSKCFRKILILSALNNTVPSGETLQRFANQPKIQNIFFDGIIYGQIAYMYCFQKLAPLPNIFFRRVQKSMATISPDMSFMERWYPKSIELIPAQHRERFIKNKGFFLEDYTEADISEVENWTTPIFSLPPPTLTETLFAQTQKKIFGAKRRGKKYFGKIGSS